MNLIMEKRNIRITKEYNPFFYNLIRAGIIDKMTAIQVIKYVDLQNIPYIMAKKINMISDMEIIKNISADGGENQTFYLVKRGDTKTLENLYTPEIVYIKKEETQETSEEPIQEFITDNIDKNFEDIEKINEPESTESNIINIEEFINNTEIADTVEDIETQPEIIENQEKTSDLQEDEITEENNENEVVEETSEDTIENSDSKLYATSRYIQMASEDGSFPIPEIGETEVSSTSEDYEELVVESNPIITITDQVESTTTSTSSLQKAPIKIMNTSNLKSYNGKNKKKKKH